MPHTLAVIARSSSDAVILLYREILRMETRLLRPGASVGTHGVARKPPRNDKYEESHKLFECARTGMSLIETLVYVAVLGLISIFITNSLIKIVSVYRQAQAEREVLSNARLMMETVTKNIAYSQEVYAPTSRFNSTTSQISLITLLDTLPEHTSTYLDFWSDGNRLLMREEGRATTTISSATVKVTQFRAERIVQGLGREAIKITLNVVSKTLPQAASATLNATTALRGNY